jgi:MoxR-like ATPase
MEERQVSIDGIAHPLPEPFFVVATQNPHEQLGTYPLPESQLDRFLMRVALGYPGAVQERTLLVEPDRRERLAGLAPVLSPPEVLGMQERVGHVTVAPTLLDYVQALVAHTRANADLQLGLSPRAGQGLVRAARAWALIQGRSAVLPEDVQAVLPAVAGHRLTLRAGLAASGSTARRDLAGELRAAVPVPD